MKKLTSVVVLLIAVLFFGCSSNSDGDLPEQTISFKFNGNNVTATVVESILFKFQSTNEKTLWIVAETADKRFEWYLYSTYSTNNAYPTGDYLVANPIHHGTMHIDYKINGDTYGLHNTEEGILTVSSSSSKKINGTFHVTFHAANESQDFEFLGVNIPYEINITDGAFTNLSYNVVN